jgi:Tfp pilus assembly PilM family ATPase
MFRLFARRPGLGLEINPASLRLAAVTGGDTKTEVLFTKTVDLPAGMVGESYASQNLHDPEGLSAILRDTLGAVAYRESRICRTALSLPDSVFRVQVFEFDDLPSKREDREQLIRWRIEKTAAFDASDTVLRHQILRRQERGFTLLACAAKREVIAQYEALLIGLGLEPWAIGLSSFHTANFYSAYLSKKAPVSALAYITDDTFAVLVMEQGAPGFYRFKEMKRGTQDEIRTRLLREIEDSLHFYTHMDRTQVQLSGIERLFLGGDYPDLENLAEGLRAMNAFDIEVLSPAAVLSSGNGEGPETVWPAALAAALGAGSAV